MPFSTHLLFTCLRDSLLTPQSKVALTFILDCTSIQLVLVDGTFHHPECTSIITDTSTPSLPVRGLPFFPVPLAFLCISYFMHWIFHTHWLHMYS
ncbi:hypothetical protein BDZ94DRAFT_1253923 [Collybia nuda]|uniref:Uncharacterized protein n=1 Tax=Collybia nuda TaxID=64659 RepID=A0A9P5Y6H2_9AGAR|nr:hypothetical protein BDZ94DRAFT_1261208 [Collybia nuda]KAF9465486.1 hypothetical protein BDZ94DRAFT_1253923 [Collybia nuda]